MKTQCLPPEFRRFLFDGKGFPSSMRWHVRFQSEISRKMKPTFSVRIRRLRKKLSNSALEAFGAVADFSFRDAMSNFGRFLRNGSAKRDSFVLGIILISAVFGISSYIYGISEENAAEFRNACYGTFEDGNPWRETAVHYISRKAYLSGVDEDVREILSRETRPENVRYLGRFLDGVKCLVKFEGSSEPEDVSPEIRAVIYEKEAIEKSVGAEKSREESERSERERTKDFFESAVPSGSIVR